MRTFDAHPLNLLETLQTWPRDGAGAFLSGLSSLPSCASEERRAVLARDCFRAACARCSGFRASWSGYRYRCGTSLLVDRHRLPYVVAVLALLGAGRAQRTTATPHSSSSVPMGLSVRVLHPAAEWHLRSTNPRRHPGFRDPRQPPGSTNSPTRPFPVLRPGDVTRRPGAALGVRYIGAALCADAPVQTASGLELEAARARAERSHPGSRFPLFRDSTRSAFTGRPERWAANSFQILLLPDSSALVAIGDVSGKGMPAALTVSLLVGTLHTAAESTISPAAILTTMNHRLMGRSAGGFTTCLILRITATGSMTGANAGHIAPFLNGMEMPIESGLPLGLIADAAYAESALDFGPGDSQAHADHGRRNRGSQLARRTLRVRASRRFLPTVRRRRSPTPQTPSARTTTSPSVSPGTVGERLAAQMEPSGWSPAPV